MLSALVPALCATLVAVLVAGAHCGTVFASGWLDGLMNATQEPLGHPAAARPHMRLLRQDYGQIEFDRSVVATPLCIGGRRFSRGLGVHAVSYVRVTSPVPIERFAAWVGVDENSRTEGGAGSVVFSVAAGDREIYKSEVLRCGMAAERIDVKTGGTRTLDLRVSDAGDGIACDHADWAEAEITLEGGKTMRLDQLDLGAPTGSSRYSFSFMYDGKASDGLLDSWKTDTATRKSDIGLPSTVTTWTDPTTGLRVTREAVRYTDFPALEWVLYFENTGSADTPIIEDIQALNITMRSPLGEIPYRLHRTNGAPSNPTDFEVSTVRIDDKTDATMGGGGGRSSNKDFPFFKIETGEGSLIVAVGWSGQWSARVECPDNRSLHVTAGQELTHFKLHPGEKVRTPRMLVFLWEGDTLESNAQFRQFIYKHYCAKREGKTPLPIPFVNTCFTRGGGWLNECNESNQISLIKAYASLGIEAVITDAGWFEGGWPSGAGNWNPRKDAYPNGMGPIAKAAKEHGMVYGLWYEPERVVAGTDVHRNHPEWCLASQDAPQDTYLLNFGLPEVQDYFFGIVKSFMELPGFRFYRQDFNMDPLPYWRYNDAPDRQGITEAKYIEGLYAYWDRIASAWPDCIMEECASGGRRIDLETVRRMHIHQESDYWFDNEVDQCHIWSLSQYLPNNTFDTPLVRLDDYSFHSTLACSLIPSWIADEPGFDTKRAKKLMDRYLGVRHLLIGSWYPLLPYSRDLTQWIGSQYHRPDLDQGMILVFRRAESPYATVDVTLHGLDPNATYELASDGTGEKRQAKGSDLMKGFQLTLRDRHSSDLIVYRKV